jgi:hypothetical protein
MKPLRRLQGGFSGSCAQFPAQSVFCSIERVRPNEGDQNAQESCYCRRRTDARRCGVAPTPSRAGHPVERRGRRWQRSGRNQCCGAGHLRLRAGVAMRSVRLWLPFRMRVAARPIWVPSPAFLSPALLGPSRVGLPAPLARALARGLVSSCGHERWARMARPPYPSVVRLYPAAFTGSPPRPLVGPRDAFPDASFVRASAGYRRDARAKHIAPSFVQVSPIRSGFRPAGSREDVA